MTSTTNERQAGDDSIVKHPQRAGEGVSQQASADPSAVGEGGVNHQEAPSDPVTDYIDKAQEHLEDVIAQQFQRSTLLMLISVGLFFALYAAMAFLFRTPVDDNLFQQLEESNRNLSEMNQALIGSGLGATSGITATTALKVVVAQAELHRQAVQELKQAQQQISPEGLNLLQLLGGSVVLALVGYLGLQRLQTIDTEIQELRKYMFAQIRERVAEGREVLSATIKDEVDKQFEDVQSDMGRRSREFRKLTKRAMEEFQHASSRAEGKLSDAENRAMKLFDRYGWLEDPEIRGVADELAGLVSVEQAHDAAQRLNQAGDRQSAKKALQRIIDERLPGSADAFHNVHTEAMRMDDLQLALDLVEEGLEHSVDQYDLMADKSRVLISLGRVEEAKQLLEDWRRRKPHEFARGWRPVVFYADAVQAGELDEKTVVSLEEALEDIATQLPHEPKPWSNYARFEKSLGRLDKAEEIVRQGLEHCPYSQELNYVLGDTLIERGRADEAVEFLKQAMQTDYHEQYQHAVNQYSIRATLAQAYEALGDVARAAPLYESIVKADDPQAHFTIKRYAFNRLQAISLLEGRELLRPQPGELGAILRMLASQGDSEEESQEEQSEQ